MNNIEIRKVETETDRRIFTTFPWKLYKKDPLWVAPIFADRKNRITHGSKAFFNRGEADFFIAWREGQVVGTIGVALDQIANDYLGEQNAFFGFFECREEYRVAEELFNTAIAWARERGLTRLQGPQSFSASDEPGVLIDGRETPPVVMMGWTPRYYEDFFLKFGYSKYRDYLAYRANLKDNISESGKMRLPEKLTRSFTAASSRYGYTLRKGNLAKFDQEMEIVRQIYNHALTPEKNYIPVSEKDWKQMIEPVEPLLDPDMAVFAEVNGVPVGFGLGIADINQALIHCNGLRSPLDYLKLWWYSRKLPGVSLKVLVMEPEWEGRGLGAMIIYKVIEAAIHKGFQWVDMSLTSEDNPNTNSIAQKFGCRIDKRYRLYQLDI